ncbi:23S rRNA pseudouridine(2605) synthase RluB [Gilvimarinus sp. F26214L]|uniref:23S rRNA pseudouridine(2605) synthase RluB n=1 Tax=Gilvimarinus sp. DZF01 TaxID=3461371 RepID=UPI0040456311
MHKVLARAGLGSRREMEAAIAEGRVRINGKVATIGDRVTREDKIVFDGHVVKAAAPGRQRLRVVLYNKPEGEICSRSDPEGRPTVYDHLPRLREGRWISVGRLDINTSGALLFTNDGDFAHKLMHPSSVIDREYLVRIYGEVDEDMKQRLLDGVLLEDGVARFTDIVERETEGSSHWYYCVVMEGRNREVRRLWESQGVKVNRLKRVRYGNIFIPSHVRAGQWVELNHREIADLALTAGYEIPRNAEPFTVQEQRDYRRHQRKLRKRAARK